MSPLNLLFFLLTPSCYSLSIGVSDKNVTKRAANSEFFPDWVPFKNKHGEELGEFVAVAKAKPKKRLAPPMNFILKAVAEPNGDDYYDKGQGESDNEDYYEKKEWSDLNRPAEPVDPNKPIGQNISDIDGIVNIITKPVDDPVIKAIQVRNKENQEAKQKSEEENQNVSEEKESLKTKDEKQDIHPEAESDEKEEKRPRRYEDDVEYEEASSEKQKPEVVDEEKRESEEKKAKLLSSVDDLKERHAQEQRAINEKVKEEELFREDFERDNLGSSEENDKYAKGKGPKWKKITDYEEYNDDVGSVEDKYKLNHEKTTTTTTTQSPKKSKKRKSKKEKSVATGKLSVFRNPQLYMIFDENESTTPKPKAEKSNEKFSAKYSADDDNVRISLVPADDDSKEGEPTRFFPKKRKNKRNKAKTTASPITFNTEKISLPTTASDTTGFDASASDTTASDVDSSASNTAPSASDAIPSATSGADVDSTHASTDKEEEKKIADYSHEKGGGRKHESEYSEEHGEHGKKAYEGYHEDTKTSKGHHDKESHHDKYKDQGGIDKKHHDEKEHYGAHHHEEHGKKHAKYEESGKHSKGHSTKGSHDIHKKDEYEKRVEFFEEDGDSDEIEMHGGHHSEKEHSMGGHYKKSNLEASHKGHAKGDTGHFSKNGHEHTNKGHSASGGHSHHGHHGHQHHGEGGRNGGKKWVYHHGYPAKTANLVVIDRRNDYQHGPQYFG
ncbi:unnamed protein product [Colias eurytheme]|nr:unnamed protein product [Colias eurytheme]